MADPTAPAAAAPAVEEVLPAEHDLLQHPTNVRIREATAQKDEGNKLFGEGRFDEAVDAFVAGARAAGAVEGNWRSQIARELRTACLNNAALARIKQERVEDAVAFCDEALAVDSKCAKALFRRAQARLAVKKFALARRDLEIALQLQPSNKDVKAKVCRGRPARAPRSEAHRPCAHARHLPNSWWRRSERR